MKKFLVVLSITFTATVIAFGAHPGVALADDPCGGTGGNGEIVSMGSNAFTLKLNAGGNLIVNFTNQATIETSTGRASAADLKIGDRVTLVGDNHRDGTFTADAVMVCAGKGTENLPEQNGGTDVGNVNTVRSVINVSTLLLFCLIWLGSVLLLRFMKKKSFVYLLFFTIFYVYLFKVLDYTLFQFQSLLLLKHFTSGLMLQGQIAGKEMNLIPLVTLTREDVKTSLLNVLMMMPFGFGLPFITNLRMRKIIVIGALFSFVIEFLQFITGFTANMTFRVADINDLVFNTVGVAIGYILFVGFIRLVRRTSRDWKSMNSIVHYIAERPQADNMD